MYGFSDRITFIKNTSTTPLSFHPFNKRQKTASHGHNIVDLKVREEMEEKKWTKFEDDHSSVSGAPSL